MKQLLLSVLLAASPVLAAAPEVQRYTARAEGSLTIGADGRVLDVDLSSSADLGEEVLAAYEERIRGWRFEPIVENGRPVNAKGLMQLSLVAEREKGSESAAFGIRHVWFMDPPGTTPASQGALLKPPSYPTNALKAGVGADVVLVLKLDAQGRVQSAATEKLDLLGVAPRQSQLSSLAAQFRRSAEKAAVNWTIPGQPEGGLVRVPVRYAADRWANGWAPTTAQVVELPEWAVLELAAAQARDLSAGGTATAAQFKLLTPLDDA